MSESRVLGVVVGLSLVAALVWVTGGLPGRAAGQGTASVVVPLDPVRILDTRSGIGVQVGPLGPGDEITVQVGGVAGVPSDATGVVLNLTAAASASPGYVTAYPTGTPRPEASVLNHTPGADVANMVTATLGSGGRLQLFSGDGRVHLVADVAGYLTDAETFAAPPPTTAPAPSEPDADAIPIRRDVAQDGVTVAVATFDGIRVLAFCQPTSVFLQPIASSGMWVGGTSTTATGALQLVDGSFVSAVPMQRSGPNLGGVQFRGLMQDRAGGRAFDVVVHMTHGSPCRVWGQAVPLPG